MVQCLGAGDSAGNKMDRSLCPYGAYSLAEEGDDDNEHGKYINSIML